MPRRPRGAGGNLRLCFHGAAFDHSLLPSYRVGQLAYLRFLMGKVALQNDEPRPANTSGRFCSFTKRTSTMARIALGLLSLTLLLGVSGCTWAETRRDYPPSVTAPEGYPDHPRPEMPPQ